MDLWSDDPRERLEAARGSDGKEISERISAGSPTPGRWPYGMPTSINPYVVFVGPSPGNSPPKGDNKHKKCDPYDRPTFGKPHEGLFVPDGRGYWDRVQELGHRLIGIEDKDGALALVGQLNFGVGQFGKSSDAPLEPEYRQWVPQVLMNELRPSYVILFGLGSWLLKPETNPFDYLGINRSNPDECFRFEAYQKAKYHFRLWRRTRPDGRSITFVLWPQHPSRAPMTKSELWEAAAEEFTEHEKKKRDATC
jgi:hypothetical protein